MKTLWTDESSEHHGELYDLRPVRMYPKPVQKPHPPIHVGGASEAATRRVARIGQGWISFDRRPYAELGVDRLIVTCLAFDVDTTRSQLDALEADVLRRRG